jgi:membrane protein YdbS with pleckstrin-like domain
MKTQPIKSKVSKVKASIELRALLILAVTLTLMLLIVASGQTWLAALAVTIVLTVLILAIVGAPELLPATLKAMLAELCRMW